MLFRRKGIRHGVACQESQHEGSQPGLQNKTLFKNKQTNKPEQKCWKENNLAFSGTSSDNLIKSLGGVGGSSRSHYQKEELKPNYSCHVEKLGLNMETVGEL